MSTKKARPARAGTGWWAFVLLMQVSPVTSWPGGVARTMLPAKLRATGRRGSLACFRRTVRHVEAFVPSWAPHFRRPYWSHQGLLSGWAAMGGRLNHHRRTNLVFPVSAIGHASEGSPTALPTVRRRLWHCPALNHASREWNDHRTHAWEHP